MFRVIHFEIHAENPERAIQFYQKVFGWKITKWEDSEEYWLISTGEGTGIDGSLIRRRGPGPIENAPVNGFVNTIEVTTLDQTIEDIEKNGGLIVVEKMNIPNVGILAYFKDTEGNIFGSMQRFL